MPGELFWLGLDQRYELRYILISIDLNVLKTLWTRSKVRRPIAGSGEWMTDSCLLQAQMIERVVGDADSSCWVTPTFLACDLGDGGFDPFTLCCPLFQSGQIPAAIAPVPITNLRSQCRT